MTTQALEETRTKFQNLLNVQKDYPAAISALEYEMQFFPNNRAELSYYLAQAHIHAGDKPAAIDAIRRALRAGECYREDILRHETLATLQGNRDFENLVKYSREQYEILQNSQELDFQVFSPQQAKRPWPLLVVIHRSRSSVALEEPVWKGSLEQGWMVLMPQSNLLGPTGHTYIWSEDRELMSRLEDQIDDLVSQGMVDRSRIIMAGFHDGAWYALRAATLLRKNPARGFIWVEGYLQEPHQKRLEALMQASNRNSPVGYLICGQRPEYLQLTKNLQHWLTGFNIDCRLEKTNNEKHCFPPELEYLLHHAFDHITGVHHKEVVVADERRKLERKLLSMYARVFDRRTGKIIGYLADLTTAGAMIIGEHKITTDIVMQIRIELPEDFEGEHMDLNAQPVWCKPDIDPSFQNTGFKFLYLTDTDITKLAQIMAQYEFRRQTNQYPPSVSSLMDGDLF